MPVVACLVLREVGIPLPVRTQALDIYLLNNHRILPLESFARS